MSVPVLSRLLIACRTALAGIAGPVRESFCTSPPSTHEEQRQPSVGTHASCLSPTDPTLRANPFPEVTDLFCRLPLPTLFYRPEAAHLGDLLRLWVRADAKINLSPGFSRAFRNAPDSTRGVGLYQSSDHISWQTDSMVYRLLTRKENSSQDPCRRLRVQLRYRTSGPHARARNIRVPVREY